MEPTATQADEPPTSQAGSTLEELLDLEFEAFCAREGDEAVTLDEVRRATASIPGSMAEAIIEDERAERFWMPRFYFDTSALVKNYHVESGPRRSRPSSRRRVGVLHLAARRRRDALRLRRARSGPGPSPAPTSAPSAGGSSPMSGGRRSGPSGS